MMWSAKAIAALILLSALGLPAHAGLIKYKDENGTLHVVQSVDDIPEKYREQANKALRADVTGPDPCVGKKMCGIFVVYKGGAIRKGGEDMAFYASSYKNWLSQNSAKKECGFKVIVTAAGSSAKDMDDARKIYGDVGPQAILDLHGVTLSNWPNSYELKMLVVNEKGETLWTGSDAYSWTIYNFGVDYNNKHKPKPSEIAECSALPQQYKKSAPVMNLPNQDAL